MDIGLNRIRVLVAEDNLDLAAAISAVISAEPDMQVNGTVDRVCQLLEAASGDANVLVLDLDLRGESSVPALVHLQRSLPRLGVIVYSGHDRSDLGPVLAGLDRCEYVVKSGDPDQLIEAIRRVAKKTVGAGA